MRRRAIATVVLGLSLVACSSTKAKVLPSGRAIATAPTTLLAPFCGAPPNPYGYNFCGRGKRISKPQLGTCDFFECVADFTVGTGSMVECNDGMFSMTGGRKNVCAGHDGLQQLVYSGP